MTNINIQVNINILNMGYLEYPAYVEVGHWSSRFLYIYDFKNSLYLAYGYLKYLAMLKKFYGPNNILYLGYFKVKSIFQSTNHTHVVSSLFLPIQTFF